MAKRIKLLVRKNLKMSEGKIAAQCVHAALGLARLRPEAADPILSVVVLLVSDKKFLEAVPINVHTPQEFPYIVKDKGYTEVASGTETVMAFLEDDPREETTVL
jgi:peptidyl-tRNA hydrolase